MSADLARDEFEGWLAVDEACGRLATEVLAGFEFRHKQHRVLFFHGPWLRDTQRGVVFRREDGIPVVWMSPWLEAGTTPFLGTLAHEAVHLAGLLLKDRGLNPDGEDLALEVGDLVEAMLNMLDLTRPPLDTESFHDTAVRLGLEEDDDGEGGLTCPGR